MLVELVHGVNKKLNLRVFNQYLDKALSKGMSEEEWKLVSEIKGKNLTYLDNKRLASITYTINEINEKGIKGDFLEAGCALGGSSIYISSLKKKETPYFIYDMFGLIPAPDDNDTKDVLERYNEITEGKSKGIGGEEYYGYRENLQDVVTENLKSFGIGLDTHNISMVKGKVQDTMDLKNPIAFAHIDVDWFNSTMTCLTQICPNIVVGGSIIIDDYDSWGGCKKASDEYFAKHKEEFALDDRYGSLKATRVKFL